MLKTFLSNRVIQAVSKNYIPPLDERPEKIPNLPDNSDNNHGTNACKRVRLLSYASTSKSALKKDKKYKGTETLKRARVQIKQEMAQRRLNEADNCSDEDDKYNPQGGEGEQSRVSITS